MPSSCSSFLDIDCSVYSFYGGLEYAVVALNIAFHGSVHMDLGKSRCLTVGYDSATAGSDRID